MFYNQVRILSLCFGVGMATMNVTPLLAANRSTPVADPSSLGSRPIAPSSLAQAAAPDGSLSNGIYHYGQSDQPEEIGSEYLIFRVTGDRVVGAIYLPRSEFSCFTGTLEAQQLRLAIIDPYNPNEVYPFAIALQDTAVANAGGLIQQSTSLEGYHPIAEIDANHQRLLEVCGTNRR
ncbi:MAG: hypothetical protein HC890_06500 [Chloroflexaceae bacterium]|nr:hypothetical protein [Chloroflexaceae bacterium]